MYRLEGAESRGLASFTRHVVVNTFFLPEWNIVEACKASPLQINNLINLENVESRRGITYAKLNTRQLHSLPYKIST